MTDIGNGSAKTSSSFFTQLSPYSLGMKHVEKWLSSVQRSPIRMSEPQTIQRRRIQGITGKREEKSQLTERDAKSIKLPCGSLVDKALATSPCLPGSQEEGKIRMDNSIFNLTHRKYAILWGVEAGNENQFPKEISPFMGDWVIWGPRGKTGCSELRKEMWFL